MTPTSKHAFPALAVLLAALALTAPAPAAPRTDSCIDCHRMLDEARLSAPTKQFAQDVHAVRGLGCAGCHGGDPNDPDITAMDPDKGFRAAPTKSQIAEQCASCHSNAEFMKRYDPQPYVFSMAEFRTSVHCKKASEGDPKVATCTNCHGVHGILSHTDPRSPVHPSNVVATCTKCHNADYMKGRAIPTDQREKYTGSVHGKALLEKGDASAPACNDCHGNHGAVPPNTRDISLVCANCHGREGELFAKSPVSAFMELEGRRGCATCHGHHDIQRPTDAMISTGPGGACGACHAAGSPGDRATATIVSGFHELRGRIAEADSLLGHAERLGMETEQGREHLRQAQDQLVTLRVTLHSFDTKQIGGVLEEGGGLAAKAVARGREAMKDWRDRRVGMALSLVVILLVIGLLLLQIRKLERPAAQAPELR